MSEAADAVLLIGHGSRDEEGSRQFDEMVKQVEDVLKKSLTIPVYRAFLEFARPRIDETIHELVANGVKNLAAVPVMLLDAGHKMQDIPHELAHAAQTYSELHIRYGDHLGFHPDIMTVILNRLASFAADPDTGILFVGRGSSDPVANAHFYQMSRMLWERTEYALVENAFIGITFPSLPQGLQRIYQLGARKIIVVPYFLFTGALFKKIERVSYEFAAQHPDVKLSVTQYFGLEEEIIQIVAQRVHEVLRGEHTAYNVEWMRHLAVHRYPSSHHHDHHHDHHHGHAHHH
ncbi:sirohydrochlorin chelatase [Sulfobacillus thermosulfidooxidans]|uniref:sirohydrochlorin chelatase n=1 Tax=Sulfobacillus thermosulfidooxidans TaxID=28034 RepID=UPI00096B9FEA|nr:sirohydrochlorin chelatase [Sulfobacillus thermosulfidooxidans]OLZ09934.1 hypothetical protein BFX05_13540 [Sulfobacillus thermosulfidooxidans]OLZ15761.1 hypothetical protein BFX06_01500 [Sulfobacillus thermosulfidooxidans]OLZ18392.1 hypothetical protein BFX07_08625 [Sulfobacillus thermosulfidooxidans]